MNVEPFALELAAPLSTADGDIAEREGVLVRIERDGAVGVGEATPLSGWTESLDDCRRALESLDIPRPEAVPEGCPAARHAVELAVVDAEARAAGVPLYRHLGVDGRVEGVPVNATVGDAPAEETAERARRAVEEGFSALKLKVGARAVAEDVDRLRAVRAACPDVELRADANGAWSRDEAREAVGALADLDVAYVEQPLPAEDLAGLADLRGGGVAVAADESVVRRGVEAVLDADAADAVVCKPMVLGGPVHAREAAMRARAAGVEPILTTTVDGAVARAAAVHVAASIPDPAPCGLATGDLLDSDLCPDPAPVRGGTAEVPQKEGNIPPPSTPDHA